MKVEFKGGRELQAAFKALGNAGTSREVATEVLTMAAEPIRDEAVALAPDDPATGLGVYLKASIKIGDRKDSSAASRNFFRNTLAGRRLVEVYVGIDGSVKPPSGPKTERRRKRKGGGSSGGGVAAYSIFQETGTSSMPAHPFMTPAWEAKQGVALVRVGTGLWPAIKAAAQRAPKAG